MRNMRRLLALLLALCMTAAVPGVAFAGDWGAILGNTADAWHGTYYCESCGQHKNRKQHCQKPLHSTFLLAKHTFIIMKPRKNIFIKGDFICLHLQKTV